MEESFVNSGQVAQDGCLSKQQLPCQTAIRCPFLHIFERHHQAELEEIINRERGKYGAEFNRSLGLPAGAGVQNPRGM